MTARIGAMPEAEVFVCMWISICFHVVEAGLTCQIWRLLELITLLVGWEEKSYSKNFWRTEDGDKRKGRETAEGCGW